MDRRRSSAILTVALVSCGTLALAVGPAAGVGSVNGTVAGTVFRDYSANGVRDTLEPGESGIVVTAYDSTGATVGSATSASDGTFTATITSATDTNLRLGFTIPTNKQAYLQPGPLGAGSQGAVRFTTVNATGADYGVQNPDEYCQANPTLVTACQAYGNQQGAVAASGALRSFPYTATGSQFAGNNTTTAAVVSTHAEVGTTFAIEYSRTRGAIYSAAFQKQYAGFGTGGPGAVYRTVGGVTALLATIPNAGTDARSGYPVNTTMGVTTGDTWLTDPSYDDVGKIALGDIALTDDEATLWVVNLADRKLYPVTVSSGVVGTGVSVPLATGASVVCASADVRPFALASNDGVLYLGETCSAQTSQLATDLRFYVYTFDPATQTFGAAPVFETVIGGLGHGRPGNGCNGASGTWRPWANLDKFIAGQCGYPQPWLTSLAFDRGNLILGVRDRFGDQSAADYPVSGGGTMEGVIAGDLLRACGNPTSGWTLETNGSCGGVTTTGATNTQGPGGGEYYFQDHFNTGIGHQETSNGGVLQVPGFNEVVHTVMDPNLGNGSDWRSGGVHYERNDTGANDHWFEIYDKCDTSGLSCGTGRAESGTFGKASGLGDLVALCNQAPVELGDRVWLDLDGDGVQDAGEAPIPGVTVTLYASNGTTVIASTTTASDGTYVFSSDPTRTDTTGRVYNLAALTQGAQVVVATPVTLTVAPYGTVGVTRRAATPVGIDSDVSITTGRSSLVTIGAPGHHDHDIDIGYRPVAAVGNYVWLDSNHDGVQNEPAANGINGVTATLQTAAGGPVTDLDGNVVGPLVTANDPTTGQPGYYLFANLPGGSYRVVFSNLPAGFSPTRTDAAGDDALDSDGLTTAAVTVPAGTQDLTLDLGIFAPVQVGDRAWLDTNRDGQQSPGEPGLAGVVVTLLDPSGAPVTADADGSPVPAQVTGADGLYRFTNLAPGAYRVHFAPPTGYTATGVHVGGDTAVDSDAPDADSATLPPGGADLTLDAGFVTDARPLGSVVGLVYVDADRDGVRDPGERPLGGVTVQLVDAGGNVVATTVTASDGSYRFDNVEPGTYTLRQTQPDGYGSTTPNEVPVAVVAGSTANDAGFGEVPAALPRTGGSSGPLARLALGLLVLGAALARLGRRRRYGYPA